MNSFSFGFRKLHQAHLAIVSGILWVLLFVLIGRFALVGREVVLANRFGTGALVDGYLFITNLITWPASVWFAVLTVVLVPELLRVLIRAPLS